MLNKKYLPKETYSEEGFFDLFKKMSDEDKEILINIGKEVRHLFYKNYKKFFSIGDKLSKLELEMEKRIVELRDDDEIDESIIWEIMEEKVYDLIDIWDETNKISKEILKPFYDVKSKFKKINLKDIKQYFKIEDSNKEDYVKVSKILKPLDNSQVWKDIFKNVDTSIFIKLQDENKESNQLVVLLGL